MVSSAESALPFASHYPAGAVVSRDLECVGCGYNLRTLHVDSRCPECGLNVEQSLLVLPQRDRTAAAVRLAAWGLLLSLLLGCLGPLNIVRSILMLVAAYRLHYKCELSHMLDLGQRVRWWWMTLLVSTIGSALLVIIQVAFFVTALGSGGSMHVALSPLFMRTPNPRIIVPSQGTFAGSVEVTTDSQGRMTLRVLDDAGNAISTDTLTAGQTLSVTDANGQTANVRVDQAGTVTLTPQGGTATTITPGTTTAFATASVTAGDQILMILGVVLGVVGFAASILYLLTCRSLANRANDTKLVRNFRTLLWLFVVGMGVMFAGGFAVSSLGLLARAGILVMVLPMLAGIVCLLIVGIWQIVASFRLAITLREAPVHWSEIAAVPEEAGIVVRDS